MIEGQKTADNFIIQSENAPRIDECPPGFTKYQDSCIQDEVDTVTKTEIDRIRDLDNAYMSAIEVNTEERWGQYLEERKSLRRSLKIDASGHGIARAVFVDNNLGLYLDSQPVEILREWRVALLNTNPPEGREARKTKLLVRITSLIKEREYRK